MTAARRAPRAEVAAPAVDVLAVQLGARRVPCVCPQQHHGAVGMSAGYSTCRGIVVERVACDTCPRTWKRVNVQ